jgi:hypothetical protein
LFYTGCGSRQTPQEILGLMTELASKLEEGGWTLRSGHAEGADWAFETGVRKRAEIYLPWPSFNADLELPDRGRIPPKRTEPQPEAYAIAAEFHPVWNALTRGAKALHARNVHQILGNDVTDPVLSEFVVGWTLHGRGRGGTGQAFRMARHFEIPTFDLARIVDAHRLRTYIDFK